MARTGQLHPVGRDRLLAAVADRIIPRDRWPSATEAGVMTYLRRHPDMDPTLWRTVIEPGLDALARASEQRYGRGFAELLAPDQDALLEAVSHSRAEGFGEDGARFWAAVLRLVAEGYYADPETGGNRGAAAWDMVGYRRGPVGDPPPAPIEGDLPQTAFEAADESYDAVVVGAGAGGAVAAMVLAEAGMRVLVVERGRFLPYERVGRAHLANHRLSLYGHNTGPELEGFPRTILSDDGREVITRPHEGGYQNNAMTVGGGTRVYGAQAWRFHPDDFRMASRYGIPEASALADWPIGYDDLEPYYDRAEWEIGVAGDGTAHPGRGRRSRPYPMAPFPLTLEGQRLLRAARTLGWAAGPVPLLINTEPRDGRAACGRCGECVGFACPTGAKNGSYNTTLVRACATGRVDLLTETLVERLLTENGRRAVGVRIVAVGAGPAAVREIRAGQVVVAAGAIESARLFLHSASLAEPEGVGNASDQVGRNLQGHVYVGAYGLFDEPVQDGLGPGVSVATLHFGHGLPGVIGGGMLANEFIRLPIVHWYRALAPDDPRWGLPGKAAMREGYLRTSHVQGPIQEIPRSDARVRLSPTVRDRIGMPVAMLSGSLHRESLKAAEALGARAAEWLTAAGARRVWRTGLPSGLSGGQHQAGTLRMGDDPARSVTDPEGRVHGYENLWVADGSLHVTNGGVNPVLTIFALAWRTAENVLRQAGVRPPA